VRPSVSGRGRLGYFLSIVDRKAKIWGNKN
jgi:hypothetical protein